MEDVPGDVAALVLALRLGLLVAGGRAVLGDGRVARVGHRRSAVRLLGEQQGSEENHHRTAPWA